MPIKLYLDENVQASLAAALRRKGYDTISAKEMNRLGCSDQEQLEFAIASRRAIFTYNTKDYVALYTEYALRAQEHYGIMVSPWLSVSTAFGRMRRLLAALTAEDMINRLEYLSNWR